MNRTIIKRKSSKNQGELGFSKRERESFASHVICILLHQCICNINRMWKRQCLSPSVYCLCLCLSLCMSDFFFLSTTHISKLLFNISLIIWSYNKLHKHANATVVIRPSWKKYTSLANLNSCQTYGNNNKCIIYTVVRMHFYLIYLTILINSASSYFLLKSL